MSDRRAFGDFQTPPALAAQVWEAVDATADLIVEPTVGLGAFLRTAPEPARAAPWLAYDIDPAYVRASRAVAAARRIDARIEVADAFALPGEPLARDRVVLAIGNPPWATSAAQRVNLPPKWNRAGLKGLDAKTGKATFDIGEAILLAVMGALAHAAEVRMAFLVKRSVALKLARDLLGAPGVRDIAFTRIEARRWFGASVEAGLLQIVLRPAAAGTTHRMALDGGFAGAVDGRFVHDLAAYRAAGDLEAARPLAWRQGIKHDLARVLELKAGPGGLVNGLGERVDVEPDILAPLHKSADLAAGRRATRAFPLYQHDLSGPLPDLATRWPRLHAYLGRHRDRFRARGSSIYRGRPDYMLFGVGPYTLAPYKVAVSGFHAQPRFVVLEPSESGAPPLVDDTSYLLPFATRDAAAAVAAYLNERRVADFLRAITDATAKRPFTKDALARVALPDELAACVSA
jgi:hypothetical protein